MWIFAFTPEALAQDETLIVLSSPAAPYVQAADACEKQLNRAGIPTKRVQSKDLTVQEIQNTRGSAVGIGAKASATLAKYLPESASLYYCMTPSPERIGLTNRPNTSGVRTDIHLETQASVIQSAVGSVQRVGVLYRSKSKASANTIGRIKEAIPPNWELVSIDLDDASSSSKAIKKLLKSKVDVIWTVPDTSVYNSATIKSLLLESLRKKIPVFGFSHALVRAGATFGIGISPSEQGILAANMLTSNELNAHHWAEPKIAVNEIAAKRIQLSIPKSFTKSADVIFEDN